jgi:hypothetical protein
MLKVLVGWGALVNILEEPDVGLVKIPSSDGIKNIVLRKNCFKGSTIKLD